MVRIAQDRHITIFSNEGRLYQVEYAFYAARNVPDTGIGYVGSGHSVMCASKKVGDKLIDADSVSSMRKVTDQIGIMMMGRQSDCRTAAYKAREFAHQFYYENGHEIPVSFLAKKMADHFQYYTQLAYRRCFGCEILLCGQDEEEGPQLFHVGPAGQYFGYKSVSIGGKKGEVNNHLDRIFKEYEEPATPELVIEEALLALMQGMNADFKANDVEVMVVGEDGKARMLTSDEIEARLTAISDRD